MGNCTAEPLCTDRGTLGTTALTAALRLPRKVIYDYTDLLYFPPNYVTNKPIDAYIALNYALKQSMGSRETKSCMYGKNPKPLETNLHTVQAAI